jgi:hypothetical protein
MPAPDQQHFLNPAVPSRDALPQELQEADTKRRYDSLALRTVVSDFARGARHTGLSLEWALDAIQDAIDSGILPPLDQSRRRGISEPVRRMASDAYAACGTDGAHPGIKH